MPRNFAVRALTAIAVILSAAMGLLVTATPALALNPCASYDPPESCFDPPAPPAAPTGLKATAILQTSVTLSWSPPGTFPLTLTRTLNGQITTIGLNGGSSTYTDSAVPPGAAISYALTATACNRYGCTDSASASLTVTTHPVGTNPVGSASGAVMTVLGDTTPVNDRVFYAMTGWTIDYDTTGAITVRLTSDGQPLGTPITAGAATSSAVATANPGYGNMHGFTASWLRKATGKGNHTTCAIAINVAGGSDTLLGCFTYYVPGPPSAATNVTAVAGSSSVIVTFKDNANDEDGYYVQRTTDGGQNWLQVAGLNPAVAGSGGIGRFVDYSVVGSGVCYRILEQNKYGTTPSQPDCTA